MSDVSGSHYAVGRDWPRNCRLGHGNQNSARFVGSPSHKSTGDGKGWSGGSTRPDGEAESSPKEFTAPSLRPVPKANQPQRIKENRAKVFLEARVLSLQASSFDVPCVPPKGGAAQEKAWAHRPRALRRRRSKDRRELPLPLHGLGARGFRAP